MRALRLLRNKASIHSFRDVTVVLPVVFTDQPGSPEGLAVLDHPRSALPLGRFVSSQNLQSVMRSRIAAFKAMGGVPEQIL